MVWGGAVTLAPADDKIITVEHPLSIDAEGQLLASILAKKGSVSATHILIDIPVGKGAKVHTINKAKHLKKQFLKIGKKLNMKIRVVITDGSQPIGNGIGPALEARDVLWVLGNYPEAPKDLIHKSLLLASDMMRAYPLSGWKARHGYRYAKQLLESGKAWEVMQDIIKAQGAKVTDPKKIKPGKLRFDVKARQTGKISHIDNRSISRIARIAGAPFDAGAGIYLYHHVGDKVRKGDRLFSIYAENRQKLAYAKDYLKQHEGVEIR
jgi:thymidine phosphorylase